MEILTLMYTFFLHELFKCAPITNVGKGGAGSEFFPKISAHAIGYKKIQKTRSFQGTG